MAEAALPFLDFLQELRRRGVPVSLAQHQDVSRLCTRLGGWAQCDAQAMARGMAALLGRSAAEVHTIEQAFFQHYALAYLFEDNAAPLPEGVKQAALGDVIERAQRLPKRRYLWRALAALAVVLIASIICQVPDLLRLYRAKIPEADPATAPKEQATSTPPVANAPKPVSREPTLPPPVRLVHRGQQALWIVPWPLLLFLGIHGYRRQKELRRWARRYWKEVRGALGGPTDFELVLQDLREPLAKQDLDDVATILGRGAEQHGGVKLNLARSVKATLERAALPTLIFDRKVSGRSLLVLWDKSAEMRPWEPKLKALVTGLMRRGVRMEVLYFDGNAARLSKVAHGKTMPLSQLQRQNPDAALLILSTGSRLLDDQDERRRAGVLAPWLDLVRGFRLRVWLHPVTDDAKWRPALSKASFWERYGRVVPMTRAGLLAAAYELAQEADRRVHIPQEATRPARLVSAADVQKMQQLTALYPSTPLLLVELLRQRFYPQIPDEVILDLLTKNQGHSFRTLRVGDADLAQDLARLQELDARLPVEDREEERGRRYLLKVLKDSEPADRASLGHLKWRLRKAMQQIYLHDEDDHNVDEAVATLKELVRGPLWQETHSELWALGVPSNPSPHQVAARRIAAPVAARLQREVLTLVAATAGGEVILPDAAAPPGARPPARPRWLRWPEPAEVVPTLTLAGALTGLVHWRAIGVEHREHILGYAMTWKTTDVGRGKVELQVRAQDDQLPAVLQLCTDNVCEVLPGSVKLRVGKGSVQRQLQRGDQYLHVQATLPKGNLAYSEAVLLPGHAPPSQATVRVVFEDSRTGKAVSGVRYTLTDSAGETHHGEAGQEIAVRVGQVTIRGEVLRFHRFSRTEQVSAMNAELKLKLQAETEKGPFAVVNEAGGQKTRNSVNPGDNVPPRANARVASPEDVRSTLNKEHMIVITGLDEPFLIDQREVSVAEYEACINSHACSSTSITLSSCNLWKGNKQNHPINCISWQQADAYCKWRKKELPTERQWNAALTYTLRKDGFTTDQPCVNRSFSEGTCARNAASSIDVPLDMNGNVAEWTDRSTTAKGLCWADRSTSDVAIKREGGQIPRFFDCIGFRCARSLRLVIHE